MLAAGQRALGGPVARLKIANASWSCSLLSRSMATAPTTGRSALRLAAWRLERVLHADPRVVFIRPQRRRAATMGLERTRSLDDYPSRRQSAAPCG